jgi:membrane protein YdbS with pleckstrin-like domain
MEEENNTTNEYLDGRVKIMWSINAIVLFFVVWLVASFTFVKLNIPFFGFDPSLSPVVIFAVLLLISLPYFAWIELEYKAFRYGLGKTEMRIRKGVIKTETYVIPYEKIQNINIERSFVERLLGIATLRIETAGSNVGESDIFLPGIGNYRELVELILGKVEQAKHALEKEEEFEREETKIIERLTAMISNIGNRISDMEEKLGRLQVEVEEMRKRHEREQMKPEVEEKMKEESIKKIPPKIKRAKKEGKKRGR